MSHLMVQRLGTERPTGAVCDKDQDCSTPCNTHPIWMTREKLMWMTGDPVAPNLLRPEDQAYFTGNSIINHIYIYQESHNYVHSQNRRVKDGLRNLWTNDRREAFVYGESDNPYREYLIQSIRNTTSNESVYWHVVIETDRYLLFWGTIDMGSKPTQ